VGGWVGGGGWWGWGRGGGGGLGGLGGVGGGGCRREEFLPSSLKRWPLTCQMNVLITKETRFPGCFPELTMALITLATKGSFD